jgi:subtilase family serine protease
MNPSNKEVVPAGNGRWMIARAVLIVICAALPAAAAAGAFVQHNTPSYVTTAKNLGPVDASQTIDVSLWLNPHNQAGLDELAKDLYDPTSPNFRHFLKPAQIAEQFAPTAAEANTVRQFLEGHELKIVRVGPHNFFVRARGTVAQVEAAFQVKLNNYEVMGKTVRANDRDPYIDNDAAPLVKAVYGLDSAGYEHPFLARPTSFASASAQAQRDDRTKAAIAAAGAVSTASSNFFSNLCFDGQEKESFSTEGIGAFPIATISGNHLNLASLTSLGCGYTPPMIQAAYNLNQLYKAGLDGRGQTIGLLEFCGSTTIEQDANAFAARFGLPPLTSATFAVISIPILSPCGDAGDIETSLDVEWAHAIAPGANINVLQAPSFSFIDMDEVEFTAVNYGLATVISGSIGSPEYFLPGSLIQTQGLISEIAAVAGISANFASGDDGDYSIVEAPTVSSPASSPFSTAVGGTSLALNADNSIQWQAGWGNSVSEIAQQGTIFDPPSAGFSGGAGGGPSNCAIQIPNTLGLIECSSGWPKPAYQKKLPGKVRLLPDIAWLADPYTGVVIEVSAPGVFPPQVFEVIGGTSAATPMFSALWAIANQAAGGPLGQAAPYLYSLPAGAITDIVPIGSTHNVTDSVQTSPTSTDTFNANATMGGAAPLKYFSAIWDDPELADTAIIVSFGTDCSTVPRRRLPPFITSCVQTNSLHTNVGWDNITGMGVPNPTEFIKAFKPSTSASDTPHLLY